MTVPDPRTPIPRTEIARPPSGFTKTDLMLVAMATIWAVNFSVVKYAMRFLTPMAFTGLRVAAAAVVLLAIGYYSRSPWPKARETVTLMLIGVMGHCVYQLLFVFALSRTRAGNAALIVASAPAFIALASRMKGIERVRRRTLAGIALSVAGVGLVVSGSAQTPAGRATFIGSLLMVVAVMCWTVFTVALQPYTMRYSALKLSGITMVGGLIPLLVVTGPALAVTNWSAVPLMAWLAVFYASVMSMVVAYLFWYRGIRVLGPTRTAAYANVQPVIALVVAWILLSEMPTVWQGIGTATIITGVFFTRG